jgi:hypothetical protein
MKSLQNLVDLKIVRWLFTSALGTMITFSLLDAPAQAGSTLNQGESLSQGQSLQSDNGCFSLVMQTDGNFVLYGNGGRAIWSTRTAGRGGQVVVMQGDGNLVMYGSGNRAVWAINPGNVGPGARLVVQDDGNAVVYIGSRVIWAVNPGRRNCDGTAVVNFPLRGSQFTELGDHRRMETSITISNNGRIDGVTHIWTANNWSGFTGAVAVVITDSAGNVLHVTPQQSYGVDCVRCPGPDDRTQQWSDTVPSNVLNQVGGYAIVHTTNPRNRWRDWLATAREAATEIRATYRQFGN